MSRYTDINQLLDEIGTSGRSANDPWTLSRNSRPTINRDSFNPAVVADLGGSFEQVRAGLENSQQIQQAHEVTTGADASDSGSDSFSSTLISGLKQVFPLASNIARFFGWAGDDPTPALLDYQQQPSIAFEGAVASHSPDISSLSYDSLGLPRALTPSSRSPTTAVPPIASNFIGTASELVADVTAPSRVSNVAGGVSDDPVAAVTSLAGTPFVSQPSSTPSPVDASLTYSHQDLQNHNVSSTYEHAGQSSSRVTQPTFNATNAQAGHSVLVQVQAMDSQSFMDHSQEIAQAVRQAMLNMNSLNDVILDL